MGRNFAASCLILLANFGVFDDQEPGSSKSFESRMGRAWGSLMLFCSVQKLHISGMRSFSRDKVHYGKGMTFPYFSCKGSDTIILLKWLAVVVGVQLNLAVDASYVKVLEHMQTGIEGGLEFSQGIFGHGVWLRSSCVLHLRKALQKFGSSYAHLAQFCVFKGWSLFGMLTKFHSLMHFKHDFESSLRVQRQWTLNPACYDCSLNEDFIGAVARQSRRISYKHGGVFETTLLRHYLLKARFTIRKFRKNNNFRPARR